MSYREENGQVVLTMSRGDYEKQLMLLGAGSGTGIIALSECLALLNRLNEGNTNYTPYQVTEPSSRTPNSGT